MAVEKLTPEQRKEVAAYYMRHVAVPAAVKQDIYDAVNTADDWIYNNAEAVLSTLPAVLSTSPDPYPYEKVFTYIFLKRLGELEGSD